MKGEQEEDIEEMDDSDEAVLTSDSSTDSDQTDGLSQEEESPKKKKRGFFGAMLRFCFWSCLILLLCSAGVAFWFGKKYLDKASAYDLQEISKLDIGALVHDIRGKRIGRAGALDRILVSREEIPEHLVQALVAAEDHRFYTHPGFDIQGMIRAFKQNYENKKISEGASTLTQQLARNTFDLKERSYERKLTEIALAWRVEQEFSKDSILEHYLNRIYFGSGYHGIGAAANGFFGKSVDQLDPGESAMLCGIIRSPSRLSPKVNFTAAVESRDRTLSRMRDLGFLTETDFAAWLKKETPLGKPSARNQMRYLLSKVEREVTKKLGADTSLSRLTIRTSIDLDLHSLAFAKLNQHLTQLEKEGHSALGSLQGAIYVIDNQSGAIRTSVGSRDFSKSEFDRIWDLRRPSGSAFFPILYAAALESGKIHPLTNILDAPVDNRTVMLGGTDGILGEWSTENQANRWEGNIPAIRALALSKNSPSVRVGNLLGVDQVNGFAQRAGVDSPARAFSSTFLGASEISLPELVRAYTLFARLGKVAPEPTFIQQISNEEGTVLYDAGLSSDQRDQQPQILAPHHASTIASILADQKSGTGIRSGGRSGTTSEYTDCWHIGFNSQYSWGVWVGKDEFATIFPQATGTLAARPIADALRQELSSDDPIPLDTGLTRMELPGQTGDSELIEVLLIPEAKRAPPAKKKKQSEDNSQPNFPALVGPDPYGTLNANLPRGD